MQDLEKEIKLPKPDCTFADHSYPAYSKKIVAELIDRLQAAEINRDYINEAALGLRAQCDAYSAELKALREQKPVAWRKEHKVSIGVEYSYTSTFSHVEDWAAAGITLTPLYAAPVAQSRDSAEPVKREQREIEITDQMASAFNQAICDDALNDQNIEDVKIGLRAALAHLNPMPKSFYELEIGRLVAINASLIANERRLIDNIRICRHSLATVEAKQAVPDGYRLLPVDPTTAMLDAGVAMDLQVSVHGQGGWSKYIAALWAQLLAAAPQVSAEQPEGAAPELKHYPVEFGPSDDKKLHCSCGNVDPSHNDFPMTWKSRFASALEILTGEKASDNLVDDWISGESDFLQDAIGGRSPWWCQNIGVIDAATAMADAAIEGEPEKIDYERPLGNSQQSPAPKAQGELLRAIKLVLSLPKQSGRIFKSPTTEERLFEADAYRALHAAIAIAEGGK